MLVLIKIVTLIVLYVIISYISVFTHEFGHYISAKIMGAPSVRFNISLKKGHKKFQTIFSFARIPTQKEDLVITIFGPFLQIIFLLLLFLQYYSYELKVIAAIFLSGVLYNLLCYKDLDGYYLSRRLSKKWTRFYKIVIFVLHILLLLWSVCVTLRILHTIHNTNHYITIILSILAINYWTIILWKTIYLVRRSKIE